MLEQIAEIITLMAGRKQKDAPKQSEQGKVSEDQRILFLSHDAVTDGRHV